ncbi:hypothetical protein [Kitasatospora sp. NPDC051164]|uniref:hypothetical protein n=1 Tax=Kitasatospora sp. NPDC051164 TaxID=3364055 RepID=UPI003797DB34
MQEYTHCPNRAEHGSVCQHREVKGYTRGPEGAPLNDHSQRVRGRQSSAPAQGDVDDE